MLNTGYVYLSLADLRELVLVHLISGMDDDILELPPDGAISTSITGYTEWVCASREVTIGWDWQMLAKDSVAQLRRVSLPSSNVMLRSAAHSDLGPKTTAQLLGNFVDEFDWQSEALKYVSVRFDA